MNSLFSSRRLHFPGANALLKICRTARSDSGAAIVEMAIAGLVFFLMLFGIVEFSLALYAYNFVSDAAREGSRYAIVRGNTSCANTPNLSSCGATDTQIATFVKGLNYPGITPNKLTVGTNWYSQTSSTTGTPPTTTYSWSSTACTGNVNCNQPGNAVQVTVTYAFPLSIPFWRATTLNLHASSQMVIAQ